MEPLPYAFYIKWAEHCRDGYSHLSAHFPSRVVEDADPYGVYQMLVIHVGAGVAKRHER